MAQPSDADLAVRARSGDREAFEALYTRYVDRIYDFCFQLTRSRDDAADVVSETFLKAMQALPTLRDPSAFRGWLYSIARNAAFTTLERRGRAVAMPEDYEPSAPPAAGDDPEAAAEERDMRRLVWEAAGTLNPRDYSIFEMTVRHELGSGEVAESLGVEPSHAYVLISRMKDTIEDALGAVVLARAGRRDCSGLDALVARFGDERSPELRRAVSQHLRTCERCRETKKSLVTAEALLRAVVPALPPVALRDGLADAIDQAWQDREEAAGDGFAAGPPRRSRRGLLVAGLVLLGAGALGGGGAWLALSGNDEAPEKAVPAAAPTATVPDVIGLQESQARSALEAAALAAGSISTRTDPSPEGEVVEQDPAPGASLDRGTPVDLVVSAGRPLVMVPDVFHLTEKAARERLLQGGFVPKIRIEIMLPWGHGLVIRQKPAPGKRIPAGSNVTMVVCKSP